MSYSVYYTYDKSKRMTRQYTDSVAPTLESHYFTYNQRDMVTQIQDVKATSADTNRYFTYNGVRERVVVVDGGGPQYWTYDGNKLLLEKDTTSTVRRYRHNHSMLDSMGSALEILDGTSYFYPAFDQFANVTRLQADLGGEFSTSKLYFNTYGQRLAAAFSPSTSERLQNMTLICSALAAASQQTGLFGAGGIYLAAQAMLITHVYFDWTLTDFFEKLFNWHPGENKDMVQPKIEYGSEPKCCGPDVTAGFVESLARLLKKMEKDSYFGPKGRDKTGGSSVLLGMTAGLVDYKHEDYRTKDCPTANCDGTITLCQTICTGKSELGWIATGYVAILMGIDPKTLHDDASLGKALRPIGGGAGTAGQGVRESNWAGMDRGETIANIMINGLSDKSRPYGPPSEKEVCTELAKVSKALETTGRGCPACKTSLPVAEYPFRVDKNGDVVPWPSDEKKAGGAAGGFLYAPKEK